MKNLVLVLFIFLFNMAEAQDECPCCSPYHNQFDFWVGEWNVYDTSDNLIGHNLIEKIEDSCIVNEHWIGGKGTTGSSYNYFNNQDSTWNQLWVDNSGNSLRLKGKRIGNQMILRSNRVPGVKVDFYYNQITWTKNANGTVTQHWDIIGLDESILATIFVGIYKLKED